MDADRPDDLSELERRLSAWEPAAGGLDADAMLFAAGRAAGRGGPARFAWPALACVLTGLSIFLGVRLVAERDEKNLLAEQVRRQPEAPEEPAPPPAEPPPAPPAAEPSPESYLVAHRALEHGLDAWPPRAIARVDMSPPESPVWRVGQWDALLNP